MQFHINKCKVFSVGKENPQNKYSKNNETLIGSDYKKDLRVRVSSDFYLRKQCVEARNKANRALGVLKAKV